MANIVYVVNDNGQDDNERYNAQLSKNDGDGDGVLIDFDLTDKTPSLHTGYKIYYGDEDNPYNSGQYSVIKKYTDNRYLICKLS